MTIVDNLTLGQIKTGARFERERAYWREQMQRHPYSIGTFPDDRRAGLILGEGRHSITRKFRDETAAGLLRLAKDSDHALFTVLAAGLRLLLYRYQGGGDIVFGTALFARQFERGLLNHALPLAFSLGNIRTLRDLLRDTKTVVAAARDHQNFPLAAIVEPAGLTAAPDMFAVYLRLEQLQHIDFTDGMLPALAFQFSSAAGRIDLQIDYDAALYAESSVERIARHFESLLGGLSGDLAAGIQSLPLLSNDDEHELLTRFARNETSYPSRTVLPRLFEEQVERTPDKPALFAGDDILSYRDLDRRAEGLAAHLRSLGAGPEIPVAVAVNRRPSMLVALLAVLKAGAAYVPLDPAYPAARLAMILDDVKAPLVIVTAETQNLLPATGAALVSLSDTAAEFEGGDNGQPLEPAQPESLAYVIYTSGSTGRPKGVAIEHRSVAALLAWSRDVFSDSDIEGVAASTSICFDLSVFELFVPLTRGGAVILADDALQIADLPQREKITLLNTVPSAMAELTRMQSIPPSTKIVNLAGEALLNNIVQDVYRQSDVAKVFNLYGPSEGTTYSTFAMAPAGAATQPAIGRPVANTSVYILDEDLRLLPQGVGAELYIGGGSLARGYLGRPALTAERFLPDPFSDKPGARLYRSGDLARFLPDGSLEFLGRVDQQVKIRGYRIEPGEIETALSDHPALREAAVLPWQDESGHRRLVAYFVVQGDDKQEPKGRSLSASAEHARSLSLRNGTAQPAVDDAALRAFLAERLPAYMLPAMFVQMDALPLTPNGKIDRRALPDPAQAAGERQGFVAPRSVTERKLAKVWSATLGIDKVGVRHNFFSLGGDSILAIQIVARAQQEGLKLKPWQLFQFQTIAELAPQAREAARVQAEQGPVVGVAPLSPVQQWFWQRGLRNPHHFNQAACFELDDSVDADALYRALQHLLQHHDALRLRLLPDEAGDCHQQFLAPDGEVFLERIDFSTLDDSELSAAFTKLSTELHSGLNVFEGPILRAAYADCGRGRPRRLLLVIHHLAVDGIAWRVLIEDLASLARQCAANANISLPPKTSSFKEWSERLALYAAAEEVEAEAPYWLSADRRTIVPLPRDFAADDEANTVDSTQAVSISLAPDLTDALLHSVPAVYNTQIDDVLLSALAMALQEWTGRDRVLVEREGHGREDLFEDIDLSRTVGWFTAIYPLLLELQSPTDVAASLKSIKEQLRAVPRMGLGYFLLRYLGARKDLQGELAELPRPEVTFNYLGQLGQILSDQGGWRLAREDTGPPHSPADQRLTLLEFNCNIADGRLNLNLSYSKNLHRQTTIETLAEGFMRALQRIVDHCRQPEAGGRTPSDFPEAGLDQIELDRLVRDLAAQGREISSVESLYPLAPMQAGMLFHSLEEPDGEAYFQQLSLWLRGELDERTLLAAWQAVVARHPALRSFFLWQGRTEALQLVCKELALPWRELDWSALSTGESEAKLEELRRQERREAFQLDSAPLMRFVLIKLAAGRHCLLWSHHHLLLDGWSLPVILTEVMTLYEAACDGEDIYLPAPQPYRAYLAWLQRQDRDRAEDFWRRELESFRQPTSLPLASASAEPRGAADQREQLLLIEPALSQEIQNYARAQRLTVNTLIQGLWSLVLSRYGAGDDVLFGVTVSGRPADLPGAETMVGLLINTLPARIRLNANEEIIPWLQNIQQLHIAREQYSYTALSDIRQWSELTSGESLFNSIVVFENFPIDEKLRANQGRLTIEDVHDHERTNYPLTLIARLRERLSLQFTYDPELLPPAHIARLSHQMEWLLRQLVENRVTRLADLTLLPPALVEQQVYGWNAGAEAFPPTACIHGLFEEFVSAQPHAIALDDGRTRLSYAELNAAANRIAHHLRGRGVGPESVVALALPRSMNVFCAMLAVLKAGGAYLPLDPSYPPERNALMLQLGGANIVLGGKDTADSVPSEGLVFIDLDAEAGAVEAMDSGNPGLPVVADRLAYIMFTSGSTGEPKGVAVPHRAVVRLVRNTNYAQFGPDECFLQLAPMSFDASTLEIWAALLNGGRLALAPAGTPDLAAISAAIRTHGVTSLWLTAGLFHLFCAEAPQDLASLRQLLAGGDVISPSLAADFRRAAPQVQLINGYGPTENTTFSCCHRIGRDESFGSSVPIGRPIAHSSAYILDSHLNPQPVGAPGELYLGGEGLARGYLGRAGLTAERFVPHPFSKKAGQRLYRSGDLARYRDDGSIEFLGRTDRQTKLRGFRIEPGEIEALLNSRHDIRQSLVLRRDDGLEAYVVRRDDLPPGEARADNTEALAAFLRERLPDYMQPSAIHVLPAIPLTPNGKPDRAALLQLSEAEPAPPTPAKLMPRTDKERILAAIWADVLAMPDPDVRSNFFDLGGDSIQSIQIVARANSAGLKVTPRQVMSEQTIEALAVVAEFEQERSGTDTGPVQLALSPIQCWYADQEQPSPQHYNQALLFELLWDVEADMLRRALAAILKVHPILTASFDLEARLWRQEPGDIDIDRVLTYQDCRSLADSYLSAAITAGCDAAQQSLDLRDGPLLRFVYFDCGANRPARLLLLAHHFVVDGVSWRILTEDLKLAMSALREGGEPALNSEQTSFAAWLQRLENYAQAEVLLKEASFWRKVAAAPGTPLPLDFPEGRSKNTVGATAITSTRLSEELTGALLHQVPDVYKTQIQEVLLAALADCLAEWTGGPQHKVDIEGHGREELFADCDLSRSVGWFTSLYPLVLDVGSNREAGELLKHIKEQLRAIPQKGIGYGLLRYMGPTALREELARASASELSFNYLGQMDGVLYDADLWRPATEWAGATNSPSERRPYLLHVNAVVVEGRLSVHWTYCTALHRAASIENLAQRFEAALEKLIVHCQSEDAGGATPSDFPAARLQARDLDKVMAKFAKPRGR